MDVVVVRLSFLFLSARLFLLACFAYFCALSINSIIATWLALPPAALYPEENLPPPTPQSNLSLSSYAIVYTRDIFNSTKAPSVTENAAIAPASSGAVNLKLLGTATSLRDRAFAILEDQATRVQGLYREGEMIVPGITLVQVGWDRVTIDRAGQQETLMLPQESLPVPAPVITTSLPTQPAPNEETDGVRQIAQDTFQIDRREVDHAISHLSELFTQVRAVPYAPQEGIAQGFRLFAIKPDSLVDRIGLKNEDIVQRVNGIEISDPSTAFRLLQDLQGHSQVRVDVLRNHQPRTLSYEIR